VEQDLADLLTQDLNNSDPFYTLQRDVRVHAYLGYDVFRVGFVHKDVFPMPALDSADTATGIQSRGQR